MDKEKGHYGLVTATTMIIGIVIGSGIFFKGDDVLTFTGGNVKLGILVFFIGAISIIFGSLTLIELSIRTQNSGGVVGYFEDFLSPKVAGAFGWFQTCIYLPALSAVVCWVAAIYTCRFFGYANASLEVEIMIATVYMILIFGMNVFSYRLGGYFQTVSTVVKLIPLLGIAFAGFFLQGVQPEIPAGVTVVTANNVDTFSWLAALIPIAFSYDGWIVTTTITNEVKNAKRNMPLALTIGPLTVLIVYLLYFIGFSKLLGAEYIMSMGNDAAYKAGEYIFGVYGSKIMQLFLIIAVLGVANGVIIGSIRLPQALASKKMLPFSDKITNIHPKYQISVYSALFSGIITMGWLALHYFTQKTNILNGGDVSEIAIVFSYMCYVILYLHVMKLKKRSEIKSFVKGYIYPIFAILGSLSILVGGIISNPIYVPVFILLCLAFSMIGYIYCNKITR